MNISEVILAPEYVSSDYIEGYIKPHMRRFEVTSQLLETILKPDMRVIDVGSYGTLVPVLKKLATTNITVTQPAMACSEQHVTCGLPDARHGNNYPIHLDRFDLESQFPYPDETFDFVLFTEVLEHLAYDPMHTLSEINRITKTNGYLLVSTPNCVSTKSVFKILLGRHPNFYPAYNRARSLDRHNREYTPQEVKKLLRLAGFNLELFHTANVYDEKSLTVQVVNFLLSLGSLCTLGAICRRERGDTIFALCRKSGSVSERYPSFLYA